MTMKRELHDVLAPYATTYAGLMEMVKQEEDDRLQLLKEACATASQTNCWFATYGVAQVIKSEIETELSIRSQVSKSLMER